MVKKIKVVNTHHGYNGKKRGYAKCDHAKAATMSKKEKETTRRKRAAQNKAGRGGSVVEVVENLSMFLLTQKEVVKKWNWKRFIVI